MSSIGRTAASTFGYRTIIHASATVLLALSFQYVLLFRVKYH